MHPHLGDPPAIDADDLEAVAFDLDGIAHRGEPAEPAEHHPANGVVGLVR